MNVRTAFFVMLYAPKPTPNIPERQSVSKMKKDIAGSNQKETIKKPTVIESHTIHTGNDYSQTNKQQKKIETKCKRFSRKIPE